ncbi:Trimethylamine dehydrogenase [Nymphon striatum]|nr:Trimethylamine dehydrogenase [Nymphon striatum]
MNTRTDEYGGSLENRVRLVREIIEDTKEAIGDTMAVAVRFSAETNGGYDGGDGNPMSGETEDMFGILGELPDLWDININDYSIEMGLVGRFTSPDTMVSQVKNGIVDFIGAARPSIADPFLPKKIEEGSWIRKLRMHLGKRGYSVMLAEATRELGGRVRNEAQLPGLNEWIRVRDYRIQQIEKMDHVEIFRESELTAEQALEVGADHIAIATGAKWRRDGYGANALGELPKLASGAKVFSPDDIMSGTMPDGPVVVYDDDHYYMGTVIAEAIRKSGVSGHIGVEKLWSARHLYWSRLVNQTDKLYEELCALVSNGSSGVPKTLKRIGDCEAPAIIAAAVYSGHRYARHMEEVIDTDNPLKHDRAKVERHAAEAVKPLLKKHNLKARPDSQLHELGKMDIDKSFQMGWGGYVDYIVERFPKYMPEFHALEAMAPEEDLAKLKVLTDHEVAAIQFANLEQAGNPDSIQPLLAYLAGT